MKRPMINDRLMNIRVPSDLIEHSRQVATEQGMSLAAFSRQSLIRNLRTYIDHERDLIKQRISQ